MATTRLDFLFEAGYTLLSVCPQLSRYYMNEFQNTLTECELNLPKQTQRSICTRCGQIQISGLTQKVRLVKKTKILNICLTCQEQKKYHGTLKQKKNIPKNTLRTNTSPVVEQKLPQPAIAIKKKSVEQKPPQTMNKKNMEQKLPQPATAIKKKNKGKKNNLQALLNKQQQNQKSSNNNNNSLNDFLSSL